MSVRKHPVHDGWYIVDHYPNGRNGKREREPFPSYEEAVNFEASLKKYKTTPVGTTHSRLEQIIDEFLQWTKDNQRAATYEKRQQCFKRLLPTFGKYRIKGSDIS